MKVISERTGKEYFCKWQNNWTVLGLRYAWVVVYQRRSAQLGGLLPYKKIGQAPSNIYLCNIKHVDCTNTLREFLQVVHTLERQQEIEKQNKLQAEAPPKCPQGFKL